MQIGHVEVIRSTLKICKFDVFFLFLFFFNIGEIGIRNMFSSIFMTNLTALATNQKPVFWVIGFI